MRSLFARFMGGSSTGVVVALAGDPNTGELKLTLSMSMPEGRMNHHACLEACDVIALTDALVAFERSAGLILPGVLALSPEGQAVYLRDTTVMKERERVRELMGLRF
jgi:hypothetical protein